MIEEKTEGSVLRSLEYKEKQRIITVFTQTSGLISLIVKGLSRPSCSGLLAITTPFSCSEFHFVRGRSDLFRFVDGSLVEENLALRCKFSFLQTAGELVQVLLTSQLPAKPSPELYALFSAYLKQVPKVENSLALLTSFRLKLLKIEGLLTFQSCGRSESYFSDKEWTDLVRLATVQQFSVLQMCQVESALATKVEHLLSRGLK